VTLSISDIRLARETDDTTTLTPPQSCSIYLLQMKIADNRFPSPDKFSECGNGQIADAVYRD
jgi:hypothetical protein